VGELLTHVRQMKVEIKGASEEMAANTSKAGDAFFSSNTSKPRIVNLKMTSFLVVER
jgi:hypothetical protein